MKTTSGLVFQQTADEANLEYKKFGNVAQPSYAGFPKMCWECNECGSQQFTMAVSYDDLEYCSCSACGCDEFNKAISKVQ